MTDTRADRVEWAKAELAGAIRQLRSCGLTREEILAEVQLELNFGDPHA